jgi:hypothetical protein
LKFQHERELRNINQIRELSISGLNKICHVEDATEAQLQSKKHLRSLSLWFDEDEDECLCGLCPEHMNMTTPPDHLLLLDSLRPHQNIRAGHIPVQLWRIPLMVGKWFLVHVDENNIKPW